MKIKKLLKEMQSTSGENMQSINVFGLGRLGLPLALHLADKGYDVTGIDINDKLIRKVKDGHMPFYEPETDELIKNKRFTATKDAEKALSNSQTSMIFVGTPNEDGIPLNPKYVRQVGSQIGRAIKGMKDYHLVVLRSTVFPRETRNLVRILEEQSGKKCGKDFGVCHNPEMLALGRVIQDLSNPKMVIIGQSDTYAGDKLTEIYKKSTDNKPQIFRTTFENAELAKVMINNYVTMKLNFANLMGRISSITPGTNPDELSRILGADPRIGSQFFKAGASYGGTCFPRDNDALRYMMNQLGMDPSFPDQLIKMNQDTVNEIANEVQRKTYNLQGTKATVMGIGFKADTDVIEKSPSIAVADELHKRGYKVTLQGTLGMTSAMSKYGDKFKFEIDMYKSAYGADACVFTLESPEYRKTDISRIKSKMRTPIIVDPWRMFK